MNTSNVMNTSRLFKTTDPFSSLDTAGVRSSLVARYADAFRSQPELLQLALNEAEALAWETSFPQLVFPVLAEERLEKLVGWAQRQKLLCETTRPTALAA